MHHRVRIFRTYLQPVIDYSLLFLPHGAAESLQTELLSRLLYGTPRWQASIPALRPWMHVAPPLLRQSVLQQLRPLTDPVSLSTQLELLFKAYRDIQSLFSEPCRVVE